nr:adenosylhomocysteinase [Methanopyrus sp. SNP6]
MVVVKEGEYAIRDPSLAPKGRDMIEWARDHMPVLEAIRERFEEERPLEGITVGMTLHLEAKTAVLVETLMAGGAEVAITGCNPLSTKDEVAAALVREGVHVYAWRGETEKEYYQNIDRVLSHEPDIIVDDGADCIARVHTEFPDLTERVIGATEETTTGVNRLHVMHREGILKFPVIAVNNAKTKYLMDNRYGTGQSALDGLMRATNILLAGKTVVVVGYGWCGRGIARRARGLGANVIVVEVDPIKAMEAIFDGFRVMPMDRAAEEGDIFITATGNRDVIRGEHIEKMKDGVILANAGHFDVEIDKEYLEEHCEEKIDRRGGLVTEYRMPNGKRVYLIAEGRLVNLAAGEGHPIEIMDISFALQALSVEVLAKEGEGMEPGVYKVPKDVDKRVAELKLKSMGVELEELTPEQREYMESWEEGT